MMFPPSLDPSLMARAFVASNGELGVRLDDVAAFLGACRDDGVSVLGWELWVVDHAWSNDFNAPVPAPGFWCGGIPTRMFELPAIVGGEGNTDETERQLHAYNFLEEVEADWLPYICVNFTLE